MNCMPNRIDRAGRIVSGAVVALSLIAGAAQAKPWAKWAPSPLASDSAYAALSARPADSLSTDELGWVEVQRDWRAARKLETEPDSRSLSSPAGTHSERPNDGRFAALASRPYASLTTSERGPWSPRRLRRHLRRTLRVSILEHARGPEADLQSYCAGRSS